MNEQRVLRLLTDCRRIINSLGERYWFPSEDRDDMIQEMAVELLELTDACRDSYALRRAAWAAVRWLRRMYGTKLLHSVETLPDLTALIDDGRCLRVWAPVLPRRGSVLRSAAPLPRHIDEW